MQIMVKRLSGIIVIMATCLLFALAWGGQVALADEGLPADGENTLTVSALSSQDEEFNADVTKADIVADVYKVAEAAPDASATSYTYSLIAPYGSGVLDNSRMNADAWNTLAEEAAKLVTSDMEHLTVDADGASALTLPDDGLYLLLPHGRSVTPAYGEGIVASLVAKGEAYEYAFLPSLMVAPMRETDAAGGDGAGTWVRDVAVVIKPSSSPIPPDNPDNPDKPDKPDKPDNPDEPDKPDTPTTPDKPSTPTKSTTPTKSVKTGDDTELFPFYVSMTVSGMLLVLIAFSAFRRRRLERADHAGRDDV